MKAGKKKDLELRQGNAGGIDFQKIHFCMRVCSVESMHREKDFQMMAGV